MNVLHLCLNSRILGRFELENVNPLYLGLNVVINFEEQEYSLQMVYLVSESIEYSRLDLGIIRCSRVHGKSGGKMCLGFWSEVEAKSKAECNQLLHVVGHGCGFCIWRM